MSIPEHPESPVDPEAPVMQLIYSVQALMESQVVMSKVLQELLTRVKVIESEVIHDPTRRPIG